jgi:ATP-binding cassette subfamily B protein
VHVNASLRERTVLVLESRLAALASRVPGIEHFERPEYLRQMDLLASEHGVLADAPTALTYNFSFAARTIVICVLFILIDPLLVFVPLLVIPSLFVQLYSRTRTIRLQEELSESRRLASYLRDLSTSAESAKEVRIFGLGDELMRRYHDLTDQMNRREDREGLSASIWEAAGWMLFGAGFVIALVFMAELVSRGDASLGDVAMAMALATTLNYLANQLVGVGSWLVSTMKTANRYIWLLDYAESAMAPGPPRAPRAALGNPRRYKSRRRFLLLLAAVPAGVEGCRRPPARGCDRGSGRRQRRRQDHARQAAGPLLRALGGTHHAGGRVH